MIQQPLAVITPIWISQHPDRQRELLRNFVHLLLYGGAFWICSFFQDRWDMGNWGRCFEEKGKRIQLWRYEMILINWNFFSIFEVINNFPYILWVTTYNTSFLPFYIGLDMWVAGHSGGGKITKHHKKADSPPPPSPVAQQIQFGNPPPLLDLINRHSLLISFWFFKFYIRSHIHIC